MLGNNKSISELYDLEHDILNVDKLRDQMVADVNENEKPFNMVLKN